MDDATADLVRVLRARDELQAALRANDATLRDALVAWTETRPGYSRRGITTEPGARLLLGQAGLL